MRILYNPIEMMHDIPGSIENSKRLDLILKNNPGIESTFWDAPEDHLERYLELAHSESYISSVKKTCKNAKNSKAAFLDLDSLQDTKVTGTSLDAAVMSVSLALDAASESTIEEPCFALTRPPGHHAARDYTGGFCIFNNIAIASRHLAKLGYRVFIFDFDVHQGNGTEDIVKIQPYINPKMSANLTKKDIEEIERIKKISAKDRELIEEALKELKADKDEIEHDPLNNNIFFLSTHQEEIYPMVDSQTYNNIVNISLPAYTKDKLYMKTLERNLVPQLELFKPDIVAVSAGFDTYYKDSGFMDMNRNYAQGVQFDLTKISYKFIKEILKPYNHFFVLEGGYNPISILEGIESFMD